MKSRNKIIFRLDAGDSKGYGHLSRNLTLAKAFSKQGYGSYFLIKTNDPDAVKRFITQRINPIPPAGFLPENLERNKELESIRQLYRNEFSFLILDHYQVDKEYQTALKNCGIPWAQFDYRQKEPLFADAVINPNIGVTPADYINIVDNSTILCVGERYAIVDDKFKGLQRKPKKNRVLIAMGGGRLPDQVVSMIETVISFKDYHFEILTGDKRLSRKLNDAENISLHFNTENVGEVYSLCGFAIVAGGVTTYELAYLGIPMLIAPFAENQQKNAKAWHKKQFGLNFSITAEFTEQLLTSGLKNLHLQLQQHFKRKEDNIDGEGANRIATKILKIIPDEKN